MNVARFADLLERTMGLCAASIGTSAVERALDARMRACEAEDHDAYWSVLQRSRSELQQLIEAVIVPETWFFRDPQAFPAMTAAATDIWRKPLDRPLRLLSLPCSTGEEPYTMAMALLDAGLPPRRFRIDAVDISDQSLTRARLGIYGRNSFRSRDLSFRDRHFEPTDRGYRISDAVREAVHFRQGNIFDADFLVGAEEYDVVFCRNLLIYFDTAVQNRAIGVLRGLLAPHGMLFVGHSEAGLMPANGFASARIPMAFAFRKASAQPPAVVPAKPAAPPRRKSRPAAVSLPPARLRRPAAPVRAAPLLAATPSASIEDLRQIADSGRLDEAARGAEAHLRECGPSADALLLLGLICDARGEGAAASRYYRKVLYLEPENHEALDHLALLLKRQGDHAGARLVDERMRRRSERRPQ